MLFIEITFEDDNLFCFDGNLAAFLTLFNHFIIFIYKSLFNKHVCTR